jgi:hypothetical protein
MDQYELSPQGQLLLELYAEMASEGYERASGEKVNVAFSDFEIRKFRNVVKPFISNNHVRSILDFGSGGSDWHAKGFEPETGQSAMEFFALESVSNYEPARARDEVQRADCVTCIDVLEHIFITDVSKILTEIFENATRCVVLNIACYPAAALLPNGENAHITVRHPHWWKGMVDAVATKFPDIETLLICSETYMSGVIFDTWRSSSWHESPDFLIAPENWTEFGKQA